METATATERNELIDLDKIKKLCEEKGISIAELGRRVGLPIRDQIHRRLNNQYKITGDEVFLIADEFGITADDLRLSQ